MNKSYMAALEALDDTPKQVGTDFVSPLGDESTELDAETEVAAFVARANPSPGVETERGESRVMDKSVGASTGSTPFAEAAGLLSSGR
jgi:hypothetical protein